MVESLQFNKSSRHHTRSPAKEKGAAAARICRPLRPRSDVGPSIGNYRLAVLARIEVLRDLLGARLDERSDAARSCSCGLAAAVASVSIVRYFLMSFSPKAVRAAPPPCEPPGWAMTTGSRKQRFMSSTRSHARR